MRWVPALTRTLETFVQSATGITRSDDETLWNGPWYGSLFNWRCRIASTGDRWGEELLILETNFCKVSRLCAVVIETRGRRAPRAEMSRGIHFSACRFSLRCLLSHLRKLSSFPECLAKTWRGSLSPGKKQRLFSHYHWYAAPRSSEISTERASVFTVEDLLFFSYA